MSYSNFDRAADLEAARQELRDARAEILKREEEKAKHRENERIKSKLSGEIDWIHPSVAEKIDDMNSEKKKSKKKHKSKSKKRKHNSEKEKKSKNKHKKRKKSSSSDSTSSSEDEWIPKEIPTNKDVKLEREDWLSGFALNSYSKEKNEPKKEKPQESYDPSKSTRELNPYWKDGGTGMPTFRKPQSDSDEKEEFSNHSKNYKKPINKTGNWRKKPDPIVTSKPAPPSPSSSSSSEINSDEEETKEEIKSNTKTSISDFLTDQQMNELGAKIIKAEIMGNEKLAEELKVKLEKARECRNNYKNNPNVKESMPSTSKQADEVENILLTKTNKDGMSCPLERRNPYDNKRNKKSKSKKLPTHENNERLKYFYDDDKYNLKEMFRSEKFTTSSDQNMEFAKMFSKKHSKNDDLDDIFTDSIRKDVSDEKLDERERQNAIRDHQELKKVFENCDKCFDSKKMSKQFIIAMGKNVYLTLYPYEGLQKGHCLIVPMDHVTCSTQLDEDVWNEIRDFMKALTKMFQAQKLDVVFYEIARYLHRRPHMAIQVVPSKDFELLPFYFKKAIQESESEWAHNKQLINLTNEKNLRRSIPKGLPYFWVDFGMNTGFAHVIEEQERFPKNFAEEIIGGLLNLDPRQWRRPRNETNPIPKVKQFVDWWKPFDITK